MLIISGIICIISSLVFKICPPKKNPMFGYKSILSMKNQDTWSESLKYSANTLIILGLILIPLQLIISKFDISYEYEYERILVVVCFAIVIIINELNLRKIFNSDGSRK
ncbi:SdpI family protein (plasmid) [Clostridium estertheticum]|uniref:SdpI family protein n=1 Tax=Clostridium estertheticum TaxID=238834 RepID=UPI001C7D76C7|nr:SdpI family protein [Clostridium estertheticum]MBX4262223.1 SdpI family protein [Clostridium estertheticum]WLC72904.1 SdpI family protein [Clostridium estertheticum]